MPRGTTSTPLRDSSAILVRPMRRCDAVAVLGIFGQGIAEGKSTFTAEVPPWSRWTEDHLPDHRFVAVEGEAVLGWVALSPVSSRPAFSGVAEVSIYLDSAARGRGVGSALLARVIESADAGGLWTLQSGIFTDNTPSLRLHQKFGFRTVGIRERIGVLRGEWRDVALLERRSPVVGREKSVPARPVGT